MTKPRTEQGSAVLPPPPAPPNTAVAAPADRPEVVYAYNWIGGGQTGTYLWNPRKMKL